jgi:hypothetical protein
VISSRWVDVKWTTKTIFVISITAHSPRTVATGLAALHQQLGNKMTTAIASSKKAVRDEEQPSRFTLQICKHMG